MYSFFISLPLDMGFGQWRVEVLCILEGMFKFSLLTVALVNIYFNNLMQVL